ncbi:MAG: FecR family protein [Desulfobacterales bacterium]|nr:FecR family protein [Desulfobacterales bacterium]
MDSFSATLIDFDGDVSIQKEETEEWLDVEINMPIQKEDHIITGEASSAEIFIDDGSTIKVEESSEINIRELMFDEDTDDVQIEIFLKAGILLSNIVEAIHRSPSVKVYTNTAVAGVRGTEFVVDVTDPDVTNIGVFSGEVDAFSLDEEGYIIDDESVFVEKGYQTVIYKNKAPVRPIVHNKRMILHKKRVHALRVKTVERRKNIPEIIQRRKNVHRRIIIHRKTPPPPGAGHPGPGQNPPKRPIRRPPPPP